MSAGVGDPQVPRAGRRHGRGTWVAAAAVALSTGALGAGLLATAVPAYADVTSSYYAIGEGTVTGVVATPASVSQNSSTIFEVTFTAGTGLSGADDNFILVQSSEALGSVPTNVYIVSGSCIQSGTAGAGGAGTAILEGVTIELDSGCTIAAGTAVQVYFTADAPSSTGEFYFTVTTSSSALATSNIVAVGTSTGTLAAASYSFGASTTYTISGIARGRADGGQQHAQPHGRHRSRHRSPQLFSMVPPGTT